MFLFYLGSMYLSLLGILVCIVFCCKIELILVCFNSAQQCPCPCRPFLKYFEVEELSWRKKQNKKWFVPRCKVCQNCLKYTLFLTFFICLNHICLVKVFFKLHYGHYRFILWGFFSETIKLFLLAMGKRQFYKVNSRGTNKTLPFGDESNQQRAKDNFFGSFSKDIFLERPSWWWWSWWPE